MQLAASAMVAMFFVITSGAFVRLTASGLGCEKWPRCGTAPFPTEGNQHAIIEFGNRMVALVGIALALVTWLASRKVSGFSPLGRSMLSARCSVRSRRSRSRGDDDLDLHPLAVMSHPPRADRARPLGRRRAGGLGGCFRPGRGTPAGMGTSRGGPGLPLAAALVVTGAVSTASGPHPGSAEGIERLGVSIVDTVYVHVRVAAVFGIGFLLLGVVLWRNRFELPGALRIWGATLAVLVAQMILGEIQYRNALPWGLVLVHVFLAATVWTLSVAIAYVLWRPPAALARGPERVPTPTAAVGHSVRE